MYVFEAGYGNRVSQYLNLRLDTEERTSKQTNKRANKQNNNGRKSPNREQENPIFAPLTHSSIASRFDSDPCFWGSTFAWS